MREHRHEILEIYVTVMFAKVNRNGERQLREWMAGMDQAERARFYQYYLYAIVRQSKPGAEKYCRDLKRSNRDLEEMLRRIRQRFPDDPELAQLDPKQLRKFVEETLRDYPLYSMTDLEKASVRLLCYCLWLASGPRGRTIRITEVRDALETDTLERFRRTELQNQVDFHRTAIRDRLHSDADAVEREVRRMQELHVPALNSTRPEIYNLDDVPYVEHFRPPEYGPSSDPDMRELRVFLPLRPEHEGRCRDVASLLGHSINSSMVESPAPRPLTPELSDMPPAAPDAPDAPAAPLVPLASSAPVDPTDPLDPVDPAGLIPPVAPAPALYGVPFGGPIDVAQVPLPAPYFEPANAVPLPRPFGAPYGLPPAPAAPSGCRPGPPLPDIFSLPASSQYYRACQTPDLTQSVAGTNAGHLYAPPPGGYVANPHVPAAPAPAYGNVLPGQYGLEDAAGNLYAPAAFLGGFPVPFTGYGLPPASNGNADQPSGLAASPSQAVDAPSGSQQPDVIRPNEGY